MRDYFYRLQMKDGSDGDRIAEKMLKLGRITAHIDFAGKEFTMLGYGEIILINKGAYPIALVKIINKVDESNLSDESFGIDYEVEVLSEYGQLTEQEQTTVDLWGNTPPTGTFFKINSGNNTFNRINSWYKIITNKKEMNSLFELINYKKQIILQGPPGTGKTREAKIIGRELVLPKAITVEDIQKTIHIGDKLKSATAYTDYEISKIDTSKVTVKIKTGSEYSPSFKEIIKAYEEKMWLGGQSKGNDPYSAALAKYIFENLDCSERLKLIQFHPAYSYEDFVRGIVVKTDISTTPEYKTVNKILAEFAKKANESNLSGGTDDFDRAWYELVNDVNDGKVKKIGSSDVEVDINTQGNIRFKSPVATYEKTYELYKFGKTDLKYETYNKIVLNFLKDKNGIYKMKDFVSPKSISSNKPYVLIIDEINRANLPAVLGELIYALEYRGEKVESMYATTEEGNSLILPPNLYIIGTMNTSDRSVGHIDYAIRRRFAFVDVLPKILPDNNFQTELFRKVSELFIDNYDDYVNDNSIELKLSEHLSEEFRPEDVWLGHSYFIKGKEDFELRKKYEIVPILKEYVKDGILKISALEEIEKL